MKSAMHHVSIILGLILFCYSHSQAKFKVDKGILKEVKNVAIVSLTIDNFATGESSHEKFRESNAKFLNDSASYATGKYLDELKKSALWNIVTAPDTQSLDKEFNDLASSKIVMDCLVTLANKNELPGKIDPSVMLEYAMTSFKADKESMEKMKMKMLASTIKEMQAYYNTTKESYAWDKNLAFLPYAWSVKRKNASSYDSILRQVAEASIKDYCKTHNLDGVIVLYVQSRTAKPGTGLQAITITTSKEKNRAVTVFTVNPTIVLLTKDGEVAIDGDLPRMDDLAPMKITKAYYDGVIDGKQNFWIDLADSQGYVMQAYKEIIDSTAVDLIEKVHKKVNK